MPSTSSGLSSLVASLPPFVTILSLLFLLAVLWRIGGGLGRTIRYWLRLRWLRGFLLGSVALLTALGKNDAQTPTPTASPCDSPGVSVEYSLSCCVRPIDNPNALPTSYISLPTSAPLPTSTNRPLFPTFTPSPSPSPTLAFDSTAITLTPSPSPSPTLSPTIAPTLSPTVIPTIDVNSYQSFQPLDVNPPSYPTIAPRRPDAVGSGTPTPTTAPTLTPMATLSGTADSSVWWVARFQEYHGYDLVSTPVFDTIGQYDTQQGGGVWSANYSTWPYELEPFNRRSWSVSYFDIAECEKFALRGASVYMWTSDTVCLRIFPNRIDGYSPYNRTDGAVQCYGGYSGWNGISLETLEDNVDFVGVLVGVSDWYFSPQPSHYNYASHFNIYYQCYDEDLTGSPTPSPTVSPTASPSPVASSTPIGWIDCNAPENYPPVDSAPIVGLDDFGEEMFTQCFVLVPYIDLGSPVNLQFDGLELCLQFISLGSIYVLGIAFPMGVVTIPLIAWLLKRLLQF